MKNNYICIVIYVCEFRNNYWINATDKTSEKLHQNMSDEEKDN